MSGDESSLREAIARVMRRLARASGDIDELDLAAADDVLALPELQALRRDADRVTELEAERDGMSDYLYETLSVLTEAAGVDRAAIVGEYGRTPNFAVRDAIVGRLVTLRRDAEIGRTAVSVQADAGGRGRIWQVWSGNTMIWSHAAIEGPEPGALGLWSALADYVPSRAALAAGDAKQDGAE